MSNIIKLNSDSFEKEVSDYSGVVLVDFWAEWCGPCKTQLPILEEIAQEMTDVKVCKVNVDESNRLAVKYGIRSIPTMIVFKNGEKVNQFIGLKQKSERTSQLANIR